MTEVVGMLYVFIKKNNSSGTRHFLNILKEMEMIKMAKNKMKQVAELLGVEIEKPFNIKGYNANPYILKDTGLFNSFNMRCDSSLVRLIKGKIKIEQPILDDIEKRYLEGVIRPFKDIVKCIRKIYNGYCEFICISVKYNKKRGMDDNIMLPFYEIGTMYKGMDVNKEYTLEELGLFEK